MFLANLRMLISKLSDILIPLRASGKVFDSNELLLLEHLSTREIEKRFLLDQVIDQQLTSLSLKGDGIAM